ncbi:helix-turn-helix domain-containing protein [Nocardia rhizosphaerae]|uniref:Helix-turn-helix domain-containing protein n=1 Tax=Nocardia rhizosphaerae TaxID=1691571 RepID=A0ABV8LC39_9NOCA
MVTHFASRLNELFEAAPEGGAHPHTNRHVARTLRAAGHSISSPYLSQLRSGHRANPSPRTVAALAAYFHVEPDYFFVDVEVDGVAADQLIIERLHFRQPRTLLVRADGLSRDSMDLLTIMAERLRACEGLPVIPRDSLT